MRWGRILLNLRGALFFEAASSVELLGQDPGYLAHDQPCIKYMLHLDFIDTFTWCNSGALVILLLVDSGQSLVAISGRGLPRKTSQLRVPSPGMNRNASICMASIGSLEVQSSSFDGQDASRSKSTEQRVEISDIEANREGMMMSPGIGGDGGPRGEEWLAMVALACLGIAICYADRSNISTAVIPMGEELGWSMSTEGFVLSAFFAGYMLTQALGGHLADRYGGTRVLLAGVAIWTLATVCTPIAARAGLVPLLATRVIMGLGEGVAFPAVHSLIASRVPQNRQSTAVGAVTASSYVGTAVAFGLAPLIISHLGWPSVFYLFGASALLWAPLWVKSVPEDAPSGTSPAGTASEVPGQAGEERPLLSQSAGSSGAAETEAAAGLGPQLRVLLKRRDVWAIVVAQYTMSWGMYGLLNWLPTFFAQSGVQLDDLAGYTLAPYVVQGGVGLMAGLLADSLISRGVPVKLVRRVLQAVGMIGPAGCLLAAVAPDVQPGEAVAVITVGLGLSALTLGAVSVSQLDIAPKQAGLVFGIGNTAATFAGLLAVPVTGVLLDTTGSWSLVFSVTAAHYVVGAVIWCLWVGDRVPEHME